MERAAAEAANALAAEVSRVSDELKSEHEKARATAVDAERAAAEARHALALRQANESWRTKEEQQVRYVSSAGNVDAHLACIT